MLTLHDHHQRCHCARFHVNELLSMCFRRVCDKGRHWGQHHRGISSLQLVRNLCCMWTLGLRGTLWLDYTQRLKITQLLIHSGGKTEEAWCYGLNLTSFIRQGNSPVGHCSGTAWHIVSVLLLLLPSFLTTKCSGKCSLTHRPWPFDLKGLVQNPPTVCCIIFTYLLCLWCGAEYKDGHLLHWREKNNIISQAQ